MNKLFFKVIALLIIVLSVSCTNNPQERYNRIWKISSLLDFNQNDSLLKDTVGNSFTTINKITKYDTSYFRTCFQKSLNHWSMGDYSKGFYKPLFCKKVSHKNESINLIKCIFSLDSNREDHILSFLVLENVGIVFETNPDKKYDYILDQMWDAKNQQNVITPGYVKSIYPVSQMPPLPELRRRH